MERFQAPNLWGIAALGMWRAAAFGFATYAEGCTQMARMLSGSHRLLRDTTPRETKPVAESGAARAKLTTFPVSVPKAEIKEAIEPAPSAAIPIETKVAASSPRAASAPANLGEVKQFAKPGKKKKNRTQVKGLDSLSELRSKSKDSDLDSTPTK